MMRGVRASSTRIEIDLVDDGEGEAALHHLRHVVFHVVAQIVEAEFVVRPIGDVGGISRAPLLVVEPVHDHADGEAEELVDLAHPLGVAPGEIVVDRHDMHAEAGEGVEIDGQRRDQRLAFAGFHFRNRALVQHHAADQLDVEMALLQRPLGGLADGGEGGREDVVERLALFEELTEFVGLGAQFVVGELGELGLEVVDFGDLRPVALEAAIVGRAEHPLHHGVEFQGAEHHRPFASPARVVSSSAREDASGVGRGPVTTATTKSANEGENARLSRR